MTRSIRLLATMVAALVVSAAASASLGLGLPRTARSATPSQAAVPAQAAAPAVPAVAMVPVPPASEPLAKVSPPSSKGGKKSGTDYALDRIPVASRVITLLKDQYLDPSRFKPKEMLVAALKRVERKVAEVLVQGDAKSNKLTLTVGSASRELDISDVTSIWLIRPKLGEALGFVQEHLVGPQDLREIEYAAVNGMLSTLDPHTILLEPKSAKEMKVQIRGEFGGVGFVIGMRNGNLTVVRVLKNTPAQRAGIKAKDVITRIDDQSTVNLDLQEAVDRLRGTPKTKVAITVLHPGSTEPKKLHIERDIINIETVNEALLPGDVGYVRLTGFTGHTYRDLARALRSMAAQRGGRLSGVVLDLRSNPGGLLDQAVQVSDLFLSEGEIVKQVGHAERDTANVQSVKEARPETSDIVNVPLVVVVDSNSASASEIVAGALKNNNRALVIGRQTFGKGSVQQLQEVAEPEPDEPDPPELKFTIAQYLTPGDLSIQETGITPDVLMVPGRALKDMVNVFAPPRTTREADLEHHLLNAALEKEKEKEKTDPARKAAPAEKPALELHYLLDEKDDPVARQLRKEAAAKDDDGQSPELTPEQQEDEDADADPDAFVNDYRVRFAAELVRRNPTAVDRPHLLEAARALVAERSAEEATKLEKKLKELGIDWSAAPAPAGGAPRPVVTLSPTPGRELKAGETFNWTVTVENKGDAPYRRLRAWSTSEFPLYDRREFVFGAVAPGEKRSWTVPVKLPKGLDTRRDEIQLHFEDEGGKAPADVTTTLALIEVPRPSFAFTVGVDDRQAGNGDGLVQRGESFNLRIDVRNTGTGTSGEKTYVMLKNEGDEKLFITKGREVLGAMKPGEVKSAVMQVELKRGSTSETLPLRVAVGDEKTFQLVTDELQLPAAKDAPAAVPAKGSVRVRTAQTMLRAGASPTAPVLAVAHQGAGFPIEARAGDFYRVAWNDRVGFLAAADVTTSAGRRKAGAVSEVWQHDPPRIAFTPDPARGAPVVDTDSIKVTGAASLPPSVDPGARLRDVFIYVNDQKISFKVSPVEANASRLEFSTDVPLQPGNNTITVFARESEELQAMRSIVVYRKTPPAVATEGARGGKAEDRKNAQP
jgi:carboxyl-terminal processing protease